MRTMSRSLAEKFHGVVDRVLATLHQQRAIEARRVLQRYRHLLEEPHETSPLKQVISISNEEEFSENAHRSDSRARAASCSNLEHA